MPEHKEFLSALKKGKKCKEFMEQHEPCQGNNYVNQQSQNSCSTIAHASDYNYHQLSHLELIQQRQLYAPHSIFQLLANKMLHHVISRSSEHAEPTNRQFFKNLLSRGPVAFAFEIS